MTTSVSRSFTIRLIALAALLMAAAAWTVTAPAAAAQDLQPAGEAPAAEQPQAAQDFVSVLADHAIEVWKDPTVNAQEREEAFRDLLYDAFAVEFISRLVLGRHSRTASEEQLETYDDLFPEYIIRSFTGRLGDYNDQNIEIMGTAPAGTRDLFVRSHLVTPNSKGDPIQADWRVRNMDGEFKIVDVKIEGVSMAITKREEFSSIIANGGFDGLFEELRTGSAVETAAAE